jgi:hypothetical protein
MATSILTIALAGALSMASAETVPVSMASAETVGADVTARASSEIQMIADRGRIGRSYVEPRTVPGSSDSGPLLTTPGYRPRSAPGPSRRSRSSPSDGLPPDASDCAAGYSSRSKWTRREFNRMCGHGS